MKKEIFCTNCGRKFVPVGREHICPSCKQAAMAAAKKAAVERAKARSYAGEACPVRISAKSRGFIETVAAKNGMNFIHTLDAVLREVASKYGFKSWDAVPEHCTERRKAQAAKVVTVTPAAPVVTSPAAPATPVKASKATTSRANASKEHKTSKTNKA